MLAWVGVATLLRFILIYFHWPYTESDEGNMGILAMHVAFQGGHPAWFYGDSYLGPLEGYVAAPLFRLFGVSLFALRAPLVLFFAAFLVSMYYLVRLLYQSEKFALASVIVLGLGSPDVLFLQLRASGEYPELELLAALMCLLATWLALTSSTQEQHKSRKERWKRLALYGLLGLIVGVALWVDLLILPFVAAIIVLLALFCRREFLRWNGLSFLLGSIIGAYPLLYYNLTAPWSQNSWYVFQRLSHSAAADMAAQHLTWVNQLTGTLFVALPMATGGSLHCPLSAIPPAGTPTAATLPCLVFQGGWSAGYLLLWSLATGFALWSISRWVKRSRGVGLPRPGGMAQNPTRAGQAHAPTIISNHQGAPTALRKKRAGQAHAPTIISNHQGAPTALRKKRAGQAHAPTIISKDVDLEERAEAIRQSGRLVILASVGFTLLMYALAPASATTPATSFRYLACLLLALPVLLWPLWRGFERVPPASPRSTGLKPALLLRSAILLLVAATFASGIARTLQGIPDAQKNYQTQQALVQDMLRIRATRVYSDYWTCNILTFLSKEKIICSALDKQLRDGYDRYLPYRAIVRAESHPTYIFPPDTPQAQAMQQRANADSNHYRRYTFDGYIIYQTI